MNTIRLGDVCEKIGSGATPRGGSEVYQSSGISLIRSQNVYNDGFKTDGLAYISDKHAQELENVIVQPGDVLLNITGDSVARVCQAPKEVLPARVNQHVAIIRPHGDILSARYLRYFLLNPSMQQYMHALAASGATRQALTKGMIEAFEIPDLPLPEQKAIASILGALDDKIELNRKMNETLEAMARAIFKSWFVDFDPILGLGHHKEWQDSPLGKIPKGWKVKTLGKICEVAIGGDWGEDEYFEDRVEVICLRGVDLENMRVYGHADAPRRFISKGSLEKRKMDERDILIAASGLGPLGRPLWISEGIANIFDLPVIYSNFCKRLKAINPWYALYIDRILFNMRTSGEIWEYSTGTALPNLDSEGLLRGKKIIIPPDYILEKYYQIIKPITAKLYNKESLLLSKLRDALLPKLLSEEIRVKDAGRFVEENLHDRT